MRFVTVEKFKEAPEEVLRDLKRGERIVVTDQGKPLAAIIPITEGELEDALLEIHPVLRNLVEKRLEEAEKKGTVPWEEVKKRLGL